MHQKDLTKGSVFSTLFHFALPMILGNILQQGYNIADTWVVGHFLGPWALAAVGSAFTLMTFLTSILLGLCMGSGTVFSLCFGQEDHDRLKDSLCASLLLTAAVAALLTVLSLSGIGPIMTWMNIPPEIREIMGEYLTLIFWGIPAVALYNFFGSYLKALGNSVVPLLFLGLSTVLNIALDLWFVADLGMGTSGAAVATVIAQYVSGAGIGIYVFAKNRALRDALRIFRLRGSSLREIAGYSVLTCLQQSVMNLGILMIQGLINGFGTSVMAAFTAAVKIEAFIYMPAQEYANAFSTFIAQNMGAGQTVRIKRGIRYAVLTVFSYCAAASALLWFLARPLTLIFIDEEEAHIVAEGVKYLRTVGPFYWGIGCLFLLYGLYRALGKPSMSVVLTVISLGTRVVLAYTLSPLSGVGVDGIWWAIPIGWVLADSAGILYYALSFRKTL